MVGIATHWQHVTGDGMAYDGPCIVKAIVFHPDTAADYADIYDGRDATSGTKFCRIENAVDSTLAIDFGDGVLFGKGVYVDGIDSAVETTVAFMLP
jgi:hypothetical protein